MNLSPIVHEVSSHMLFKDTDLIPSYPHLKENDMYILEYW